jgi:hypothetical protein
MAKNYCRIYFVALFCLLHVACVPQARLKDVYTSQIGVREQPKGSNWGPEVGRYLKSVNLNVPAPWCAAFVHWCLDKAGIPNSVTAWSPTAHNKNNIVYYQGKFKKEPAPGDVFTLWFPKLKRIAHTGFVDKKINSTIYLSVEGNTNEAGSREGDGVMRRYRSFRATWSITRYTQ